MAKVSAINQEKIDGRRSAAKVEKVILLLVTSLWPSRNMKDSTLRGNKALVSHHLDQQVIIP